jgi:large subunit ribosomal protein L18
LTTKRIAKIRLKRRTRVRVKIHGSQSRPRLSVFRSAKHIYVQAIDDDLGRTLAAASTTIEDLRGQMGGLKKVEQAKEVGKRIAENLLAQGIEQAVFDRGCYIYHGRIKALADAARESGIKF